MKIQGNTSIDDLLCYRRNYGSMWGKVSTVDKICKQQNFTCNELISRAMGLENRK
jgi:hypothetical protein